MSTSVEKVNEALDALAEADLSTLGVNALMAVTLRSALPLVRSQLIPDDPDQLDELLAGCAGFCLNLRSDDAAPLVNHTPDALEAPDHAEAPTHQG